MTIMTKSDLLLFLKKWKNTEAAEYAYKLCDYYGLPDYSTPEKKGHAAGCCWVNIAGVDYVKVKDEAIEHSFPMDHTDFVYSTIYCDKKIKPSHIGDFAKITGSIMIDGLKNEATARCGMLLKNAVTLQFVQDVIAGKAPATKAEYSKRIKANKPTIPYKDAMMEADEAAMQKKAKDAGIDMESMQKQQSLLDSMGGMMGGIEIGY